MVMEQLKIRVFMGTEKKRREEVPDLNDESLKDNTSHFLGAMGKILKRNGIDAAVRFHEWPMPHSTKKIYREGDTDYTYLEDPAFNADITVCALPDINRVDGAVGQLWLRNPPPLHLCILTRENIPDVKSHRDLYKGLLALPAGIKRNKGAQFFLPITEQNENGEVSVSSAVDSRHMTIDSFKTMNRTKMSDIVDLVRFQWKH